MEPRRVAVNRVLAIGPFEPVIAPPSAEQALLEGLVFKQLGTLFLPDEGPTSIPGRLEVKRIEPELDRLTVHVRRGGSVTTIAAALFPEWDEGTLPLDLPAAGLRLRGRGGTSTEVYRPGYRGSVVFRGIGVSEVRDAHAGAQGNHRCPAVEQPKRLHVEECGAMLAYDTVALAVISSVVRRLGLFTLHGAVSIDAWLWNPNPGAVVVEAWFAPDPLSDSAQRKLLSQLTSPALFPQWELTDRTAGGNRPVTPFHHLKVVDTAGSLQLRLFPTLSIPDVSNTQPTPGDDRGKTDS